MKIRPVGAELFHTNGQTDMTKLIVALRNFANEPKKKIVSFKKNGEIPTRGRINRHVKQKRKSLIQ